MFFVFINFEITHNYQNVYNIKKYIYIHLKFHIKQKFEELKKQNNIK